MTCSRTNILHHFWVKGLQLVFADVNKQMDNNKNHCPWSVLNRDLDTLKRRVVTVLLLGIHRASVVVIRFCRGKSFLNQNISLRKVSQKLRGGGAKAPGATPLPTPMMSLHVASGGGRGGGTRLSRLPLYPPLAMQIGSVML